MAIQQLYNVSGLFDANRPFVWKYKSTNGAVNIVYRVQIWNATSGMYVSVTGLMRQPLAWGSSNEFLIDPSQLLIDEMTTTCVARNGGGAITLHDNAQKFRLLMVEEYFTSSNGHYFDSNESNWLPSYVGYCIGAAVQHHETYGATQDEWLQQYVVRSGTWEGKFLTNRPNKMIAYIEDSQYNHIFHYTKSCEVRAFIKGVNGSMSTHFAITNLLNDSGKVLAIGMGVPNIQKFLGTWAWAGYLSSVGGELASVHYYIYDNFNNMYLSRVYSYRIAENCSAERCRVYWQNRKGGVDGYTFKGELSITNSIKKKKFRGVLGHRRHRTEDENSSDYAKHNTFNQRTRTGANISIKAKEKINLISQPHKKDELRWLSEIYTSPKIWVESLENGRIISASCLSQKASLKTGGTSIDSIKLSLELSNDITTQR